MVSNSRLLRLSALSQQGAHRTAQCQLCAVPGRVAHQVETQSDTDMPPEGPEGRGVEGGGSGHGACAVRTQ